MKKSVCIILSIMIPFIIFISCKPKIDIEKEKEAIKAVINSESQAYIQEDTAKVFSYYIRDNYQSRLAVQCDTFTLYRGWEEVSTFFKNADLTGISNLKYSKDFYQIKVIGDVAWTMYKDTWTFNQNDTTVTGNLLITMILEKKENEWKISGFSLYGLKN